MSQKNRQQNIVLWSQSKIENSMSKSSQIYLEPQWESGTKLYTNSYGHMANIFTMPMYGKNLQMCSLEPQVQ